jgi:zinc protease
MTEQLLPNGMRIIWFSDFFQPVMTLTMQFPVGQFHDPSGAEGTADATIQCMVQGVASLTSEQFADSFENVGAHLYADVTDEYSVLGVRMLEKASDQVVPLFWEMITNPALNNHELKRIKKEMVTGSQTESAEPNALARKHFLAELFGSSNPAGRHLSQHSIKKISSERIKEFYHSHIVPDGAILIIAGAMSVSEMQKKWKNLFISWIKEGKSDTLTIEKPVLSENRIRIINKPDFSQTTIFIGHPSINELHEKKNILALANYILGGGNFSSRLLTRIRTETGQTYGIASHLSTHQCCGVFNITTATQNHQLKNVITSIFDVYNEFVEKGVLESELEKARQFAVGNSAFELEGLNNVVEKLLWLRFYGRENAYIESYERRILDITSGMVQEALSKDFLYRSFVIVAVGNKKDISNHLEHLGVLKFFEARENIF